MFSLGLDPTRTVGRSDSVCFLAKADAFLTSTGPTVAFGADFLEIFDDINCFLVPGCKDTGVHVLAVGFDTFDSGKAEIFSSWWRN